jgi:hypothetical protein
VDVLYAHVKDLSRRLVELAAAAQPPPQAQRPAARAKTRKAPRAKGSARKRRGRA